MGTGRPATKKLDDLERPPYGWVLKREYSDTGRDVYIPSQAASEDLGTKQAATFIKDRVAEAKDDDCSWLCQELVPFLASGEIRFVCVGGTPIREVVTGTHQPGHADAGHTWSYEGNDCLKMMSDLQ
jgi:hypothetical protein